MNIFDLSAKITLDSSQYEDGLSKVKKGFGVLAKAAGAAVAAAGAAVVSIGPQAIESYANYEQLVGGVETLFGAGGKSIEEYAQSVGKSVNDVKQEYNALMASQNKVLENAQNAYLSAGLSANEYMETVTSFSASLLQSLGGETQKAAEYSDRAITDMADNANKMGTSMESIQNAYQGFAKQNYTMLDNLKLGYGGTKEEMARLISDAAKLTDVQKELGITVDGTDMSFGNIVNAISVVQSKMGIMGTTANEAATTIQGSTAMMKAAWSNLLVGIADDNADFDSLINNFVGSVSTVGKNIIPRVETTLKGIGKLVKKLVPIISEELPKIVNDILPDILESAVTLVNGLISGFVQMLPTLVQSGGEMLMSLIQGLVDNAPAIIDGITAVIAAAVEFIAESAPTIIGAAVQLIDRLVESLTDPAMLSNLLEVGLQAIVSIIDGLIGAIPQLIDAAVTLINNLVDFILDPTNIGNLIEAAVDIIMAIATGLITAIPKLIDAALKIVENLIDFIIDPENMVKLIEAAVEIIMAIADGLINAIPQLVDASFLIIENLVNYFLDPNNLVKLVTASIEMMAALVKGIIKAIPQLLGAVVQVVGAIVKGLGQAIGKVVEVGKNIVKGVWDGIKAMGAWIRDKVTGFFGGVVDGVKNFLGIHSPSKVFSGIGKFMAMGLGEGWDDEYSSIKRDIEGGLDFSANANISPSVSAVSASSYGGNGGDGGVFNIVVQSVLDGRVIGETAYKYNRNKLRAAGV